MSLPHSKTPALVKAYPGETTEAFCDGQCLLSMFFLLGGASSKSAGYLSEYSPYFALGEIRNLVNPLVTASAMHVINHTRQSGKSFARLIGAFCPKWLR